MRPHYRSKLVTVTVNNLDELLAVNRRIDATGPTLYRSGGHSRNEIQHVRGQDGFEDEYSSEEEASVNAVQRKFKDDRKPSKPNGQSVESRSAQVTEDPEILCWNCRKMGHHWRTCRETKLVFCYACGNIGRTTRTCEMNHPIQQVQARTQNSSGNHQQSLN